MWPRHPGCADPGPPAQPNGPVEGVVGCAARTPLTHPTRRTGRGVEVVAEPELEHEQAPEAVGVVAAAFEVLVDQGFHGLGAEDAAAEREGVEQHRPELVPE